MVHPERSQAVKVAVMLGRQPDDLGDWLADGAAFEAAGVEALWVDLAPESQLDPLALTAALAAFTFRSLVIMNLPVLDGPSQAVGRMLATVGRLSHGRLRVLTDAGPVAELAAGVGAFRRVRKERPEVFEHVGDRGEAERWLSAPAPDSRAAWRATCADAAERGFDGLLVAAGPRLLDILRNPDDRGDRSDLQLAQG